MEIWKNIKGFNGDYQVSDKGRVKSFKGLQEKILSLETKQAGYSIVQLSKDGKYYRRYVHDLVIKAFVSEMFSPLVIHHKDFNKSNNKLSNLSLISNALNSKLGNGRLNIKGYVKVGDVFKSQITIDKKLIHLGNYLTQKEASYAYKLAVDNIDNFDYSKKEQFIDFIINKTIKDIEI